MISIGNLAMGGRGKTPVAALVARMLVDAGERPAVLSRGYRRRRASRQVVIVSDGTNRLADLDRSGDEPLMLARQVPGAAVLVCPIRALAAAVAERDLGATVHVLDDGFQHALARDVDIVIVAPEDLAGRRLPFGRLRSKVGDLGRADAVIVDGAPPEVVASVLDPVIDRDRTAVFSLARAIGEPRLLEPRALELSRETPVAALAGIAAPQRFVDSLERAGWRVAGTVAFRDHHPYDRRDLARLAEIVRVSGARAVLTTEKDAVRLLPLRPLPVPVAAVPLAVSIEPTDRFHTWLFAALEGARA